MTERVTFDISDADTDLRYILTYNSIPSLLPPLNEVELKGHLES